MGTAEQHQHKVSLLALQHALVKSCHEDPGEFKDLTIRLYHPNSDSLASLKVINKDFYRQLSGPQKVIYFQQSCPHILPGISCNV